MADAPLIKRYVVERATGLRWAIFVESTPACPSYRMGAPDFGLWDIGARVFNERFVELGGESADAVLRDLLATLPACDDCAAPATKAFRRAEGRWCDDCAPDGCPDYPRAAAVRRARILLEVDHG